MQVETTGTLSKRGQRLRDVNGIAWTRWAKNIWTGCTHAKFANGKERPACQKCYAERMSKRNTVVLGQWGDDKERRITKALADPHNNVFAKWDKIQRAEADKYQTPPFVFLNDMSDFAEDRPELQEHRRRTFEVCSQYTALRFLILTKRVHCLEKQLPDCLPLRQWPLNFYLGITIENQLAFDEGWPVMQRVAERWAIPLIFFSMEPLFGAVNINAALHPRLQGRSVDWVIVGGESGADARETKLEALISVAGQVTAAKKALFVKQLGSKPTLLGDPWQITDFKGDRFDEFPHSLQVREFPQWQEEAQ